MAAYFDTLAMAGASLYQSTPNGVALPYDKVLVSGLRSGPPLTYTLVIATTDPNSSPPTATFNILASVSANSNFKIADLGVILNYDPNVVSISGVFLPSWMSTDVYSSTGNQIYTPNYNDNGTGNVLISCYGDNPQVSTYDPNDANTPSFPLQNAQFAEVILNVLECNENPQLSLSVTTAVNDCAVPGVSGGGTFSIGNYDVTANSTYTSPLCTCSGKTEGAPCTGINTITDIPTWSVYPNPFGDNITIILNLSEYSDVKISLEDILGQKILTRVLGDLGAGTVEQTIQMPESMSRGLYIVRLSVNGKEYSNKIIKD